LINDGPMSRGAGAVAVQVEIVPPQQPGQPHGMRFYWAGDARAMLLRRGPDGKWNWTFRTVDENAPNKPGLLEPGVDFEIGGRGRTLAGVRHPLAHRVLNAVGIDDVVELKTTANGEVPDPQSPTGAREAGNDYKNGIAVQSGDMLLVGSDGFWENFGNTKVAMELIQNAKTATEANRILTEETHARMRVLSQARNFDLPQERNGRFRFERPEGTVYMDGQGIIRTAKTMWIDKRGAVYDSATAEKAVDNYKLDNFSLMVYQH